MTAPTQQPQPPSPLLFFGTANAYQRTQALKAAIELDLFTAIGAAGEQGAGVAEIAARISASEKGTRVLSDFLTIMGFLTKKDDRYRLTPDSAMFLDKRSPAYLGGALTFLNSRMLTQHFDDLAATVRKGGTVTSEHGTVGHEDPIWIDFARGMAPLTFMPAQFIAEKLGAKGSTPMKVLDIAAGHGVFGVTIAQHNPKAEITAVDWGSVLQVARENAQKAGVESRWRDVPGSAFEVDFGTGYDVALLTNFLHHFDVPTCEKLLRKVHAALKPGGRAVTLEFVPNDDRVTPPEASMFAMIMLASTPSGDAYTFRELESMARNAGFASSEEHAIPGGIQSVIISTK